MGDGNAVLATADAQEKQAESRMADDRWKRFSDQIFRARILSSTGVNSLLAMRLRLHAREFEASGKEEQWTATPRSLDSASSSK